MKTTIYDYEIKCPNCGKNLDAATSISDPNDVPDDGSISICIECSQLNIFKLSDDKISLVKMSSDELEEIRKNEPETYDLLVKVKSKILSFK